MYVKHTTQLHKENCYKTCSIVKHIVISAAIAFLKEHRTTCTSCEQYNP